MAGYSGTPLAGNSASRTACGWRWWGLRKQMGPELEPIPEGVRVGRRLDGEVDLAMLFVTSQADLAKRFPKVAATLPPAGPLWVALAEEILGVATDLTEDVLREVCLPLGWVDVKVSAVTDVWSGLKFVLRKENR